MADMSNPMRHNAGAPYPKNTAHTAYNRPPAARITPPPSYRKPTNSAQRRPTVEHIKPLNPQMARARVASASSNQKPAVLHKKKNKRKADRTKLHDFLLGFFVGLIIFGIAAVIICGVLIGMIL